MKCEKCNLIMDRDIVAVLKPSNAGSRVPPKSPQ
jgi:transposase